MLSNWFKRSELACQCHCGFDTVDFELMMLLNIARSFYGKPLVVTSGCRCKEHNKRVGGAKESSHLTGKAADFRPLLSEENFEEDLKSIHAFLLKTFPNKYGIAIKDGKFIHVDSRPGPHRWKY